MKPPLSPWTYLRRNKRRVLPMVIILSFVVLVAVAVNSTLTGIKEGALAYGEHLKYFTRVLPKKKATLDNAQLEALAKLPAVDRVIHSNSIVYRVSTIVSYFPFPILAVSKDDIPPLMQLTGARLVDGRLPEPGKPEVALHEMFLRANGHWIGSEFGMDVNDDDWMPGRFKIVGVLSGPTPIGFGSLEYISKYPYAPKLWERPIVLPKPGRKAAMDEQLYASDDVKAFDYRRFEREINESFNKLILIVNFITVLLMVVVSIVVGLLNSIFFAARLDEFAILLAMGHTRARLLGKVLMESFALTMMSWVLGLLLAEGVLYWFRMTFLVPRGIMAPQWMAAPVLFSLMLPVIAMIFSSFTVVRRLSTLDPVLIIERRG